MIIQIPQNKDLFSSIELNSSSGTIDETLSYDEIYVATGAVLHTTSGITRIRANKVIINGTLTGDIIDIYAIDIEIRGQVTSSAGDIKIRYLNSYTKTGTTTATGGNVTETHIDLV